MFVGTVRGLVTRDMAGPLLHSIFLLMHLQLAAIMDKIKA